MPYTLPEASQMKASPYPNATFLGAQVIYMRDLLVMRNDPQNSSVDLALKALVNADGVQIFPDGILTTEQDFLLAFEAGRDHVLEQTFTVLARAVIGIGAGIGITALVFEPGNLTPGPGVYTDWADLMAAANAAPGPVEIRMSDAFAAVEIPAGVHVFAKGAIFSALHYKGTVLTILDGATLEGVREFKGALNIDYQGTVDPCIVFNASIGEVGGVLIIDENVEITISGGVPFIRIEEDRFPAFIMRNGGLFNSASMIELVDGNIGITAALFLLYDAAGYVPDALITAGLNTALFALVFSSSARKGPMAGFAGSIIEDITAVRAENIDYTAAVAGDWTGVNPTSVANALDRIAAAAGPIA